MVYTNEYFCYTLPITIMSSFAKTSIKIRPLLTARLKKHHTILRLRFMHPLKHFVTITRHRHEVIKNCFKAGIPFQGLKHDLSKYSFCEFSKGAKYFQGTRSPNEAEREEYGYSLTWMHHKGRNRHHFEYWTDYDPVTKKISPVKMPRKYVVEMFCDRVAASKIYMKDKYTGDAPLAYFLKAKKRRFIHKETSDELEYLLVTLSEKGEKAAFAAAKAYRKGDISLPVPKDEASTEDQASCPCDSQKKCECGQTENKNSPAE